MTLPNERTRAVLSTREFLYQLLIPKKTKGVPKVIRETARLLLRHYPSAVDLKQAGEQAAEVFDAATADKYADEYCAHFAEEIARAAENNAQ